MECCRQRKGAENDVGAELAEGTGGIFFHNRIELNIGFELVATAPEVSYVLGFSPAAVKSDGRFHSLKIRLPNEKAVSIEARRGYYAVGQDSPDRTGRADVDDAVFSRREMSDIPVILQTGYSKPQTGDPKVMVLATVDVTTLQFRKASDPNRNS